MFFRGYIPNLLGILPYAGIDLAVYEVSNFSEFSQSINQIFDEVFPPFFVNFLHLDIHNSVFRYYYIYYCCLNDLFDQAHAHTYVI